MPIKKYQVRHATFNGSTLGSVEREVMTRRDAVAAIVYDPNERLIVLLEQFRIGAINDPKTPWLFEIVAGLTETGESYDNVARREIFEETGLKTTNPLYFIQSFYTSPGGSSEQVHLFSATADLKNTPKEAIYGLSSEQEDIKRHIVSRKRRYLGRYFALPWCKIASQNATTIMPRPSPSRDAPCLNSAHSASRSQMTLRLV